MYMQLKLQLFGGVGVGCNTIFGVWDCPRIPLMAMGLVSTLNNYVPSLPNDHGTLLLPALPPLP